MVRTLLLLLFSLPPSLMAADKPKISFSITGENRPVSRSPIKFDILRQEAPKSAEAPSPPMRFSVYRDEDVIAEEKARADKKKAIEEAARKASEAAATKSKQEACMRMRNRVLVFHTTRSSFVNKKVYECDGRGSCRWVTRLVEVKPEASEKFLRELQALEGWKCSPTEYSHWVLVDVNDPKNAVLVKQFAPNTNELPVIVRETDPKIRRSAVGMDGKRAGEWWNQQFQEQPPQPRESSGKPGAFHFDDEHPWTHPADLRRHLMDPRSPHHLPKAVVDSWSDPECVKWHNWHHEVLSGNKAIPKPLSQSTPRKFGSVVSLGYSQGSYEHQVASFAMRVAQQTARAPPSQSSFGSDPKKAKKAEKKWKNQERERVRKEVRRQVWNEYATFDPFTWITIISIIFRVLSLIYDMYGLR